MARLGRGGMGQVFLGQSPGGRKVAVKVIRPELADDPDFRSRFAQEVATARAVSGIFTVPVVDADPDARQPWLVTAYVEGPSLADAVASSGPMPPAQARALAAGLAEGLEAIHAAGVVHRDLKPSNVMLAADGPRIIDFGISRAMDATRFTRTGGVVGSPGFMSPEQATGMPADAASDIFSLGSVLAFAATGQGPFGTGTVEALLYRIVHDPPDIGRLPAELGPLVERCLTKDPRQRPTAAQIVADLGPGQPLLAGPPSFAPTVTVSGPGQPHPGPVQHPAGWFPSGRPAPHGQPPPFASPGHDSARQHEGFPGTWPEQSRGLSQPPHPAWTRPGRNRSRAWGAPAGLVIAAGVVAGMILLSQHPATTAPPGVAGPTVSANPVSANPVSANPGWTVYADPGEFSIKLPPGWTVISASTDVVRFSGPQPGFVALVAWTSHPQPDAYKDWQQQAAVKAQHDPAYQQLGIRRASYRDWNAADWEFLDTPPGMQLTHYLDRGFITTPGVQAYAIELYGPDAAWSSVQASVWNGLTQSFQPAS